MYGIITHLGSVLVMTNEVRPRQNINFISDDIFELFKNGDHGQMVFFLKKGPFYSIKNQGNVKI